MKKLVLITAVMVSLSACAAPKAKVVSADPNWLRIGSEPQGYPRTFIERFDSACIQVTESWKKGKFKDQAMWLKQQSRTSVTCP